MLEALDRYTASRTESSARDEHYRRPRSVAGHRAVRGGRSDVLARDWNGDPGRSAFGDRLEKIAYNALPATLTADMWAHQYDQQAEPGHVLASRTARLDDQRSGVEHLRPGAELRMLHREHASGLAEAGVEPVDGDPDGGLAAVVYGPSEVTATTVRRQGGHDRGDHRLSVPRSVSLAVKIVAGPRVSRWRCAFRDGPEPPA